MTYDDELEAVLRTLAERLLESADEFVAIIRLSGEPTIIRLSGEGGDDSDLIDEINDAAEEIVEIAERNGHTTPDSIYLQGRGSIEYREVYGDFESITTTIQRA